MSGRQHHTCASISHWPNSIFPQKCTHIYVYIYIYVYTHTHTHTHTHSHTFSLSLSNSLSLSLSHTHRHTHTHTLSHTHTPWVIQGRDAWHIRQKQQGFGKALEFVPKLNKLRVHRGAAS